jgi:hypothetical protein
MIKTTSKTFGKRTLSLFLAMVMVFSLFVIPGNDNVAYADGDNLMHLTSDPDYMTNEHDSEQPQDVEETLEPLDGIEPLAAQFPDGGIGFGGRRVMDYDGPTSHLESTFELKAYNNVPGREVQDVRDMGIDIQFDLPFGTERYDLGFLLYQRMQNSDGTWTPWETRSTHEARELNVLVISPDGADHNATGGRRNRVRNWLISADVDPDRLLRVSTVTVRMFAEGRVPANIVAGNLGGHTATTPPISTRPVAERPLDILIDPATGRHRFDVIVIGTENINGGTAISRWFSNNNPEGRAVQAALNAFLDSGRGILFGHDVFFDRAYAGPGGAAARRTPTVC